jgi:oligoribonuclease
MTGLDDQTDRILEVAVIVTRARGRSPSQSQDGTAESGYQQTLSHFEELETFHRVVFQPPQVLEAMNDWCKKTHGASGLTAEVPHGAPLAEVESALLALIDRHYAPDERVVLCGNSVGNDKRFIDAQLPRVAARLHYRIIDVSSFKEVFRSRLGLTFSKPEGRHRALEDIRQSIAELGYYLSFLDGARVASAQSGGPPTEKTAALKNVAPGAERNPK